MQKDRNTTPQLEIPDVILGEDVNWEDDYRPELRKIGEIEWSRGILGVFVAEFDLLKTRQKLYGGGIVEHYVIRVGEANNISSHQLMQHGADFFSSKEIEAAEPDELSQHDLNIPTHKWGAYTWPLIDKDPMTYLGYTVDRRKEVHLFVAARGEVEFVVSTRMKKSHDDEEHYDGEITQTQDK